jgi:hypothetical protein
MVAYEIKSIRIIVTGQQAATRQPEVYEERHSHSSSRTENVIGFYYSHRGDEG